MQNENLDLQVDYWPIGSACQTGKREEKKEPNKVIIEESHPQVSVV